MTQNCDHDFDNPDPCSSCPLSILLCVVLRTITQCTAERLSFYAFSLFLHRDYELTKVKLVKTSRSMHNLALPPHLQVCETSVQLELMCAIYQNTMDVVMVRVFSGISPRCPRISHSAAIEVLTLTGCVACTVSNCLLFALCNRMLRQIVAR